MTTQKSTAIALSSPTREQIDLWKRTIARGLSDDEFAMLLSMASRLGLDPVAKQLYAIPREVSEKLPDGTWTKRRAITIQVGIDGYREIAARSDEMDGQEGPFWCADDGVWRDVWLGKGNPFAAKVVVYRKGSRLGFTGIARFASYAGGRGLWQTAPDTMIAKCAEALALRKAFPAQLAGTVVDAEIEAVDVEVVEPVKPAEVAAVVAAALPPPAAPAATAPAPVSIEGEIDAVMTALRDAEKPEELQAIVTALTGKPWGRHEGIKAEYRKAKARIGGVR